MSIISIVGQLQVWRSGFNNFARKKPFLAFFTYMAGLICGGILLQKLVSSLYTSLDDTYFVLSSLWHNGAPYFQSGFNYALDWIPYAVGQESRPFPKQFNFLPWGKFCFGLGVVTLAGLQFGAFLFVAMAVYCLLRDVTNAISRLITSGGAKLHYAAHDVLSSGRAKAHDTQRMDCLGQKN